MKIEVHSESSVRKELRVSVPEERILEEMTQAFNELQRDAQIPGFRRGKVPRHILEKKFSGAVENDVIKELLQKSLYEALEKNALIPVANPQLLEQKREKGSGFHYKAKVEVKPQFEPKDYEGVKLKKKTPEVTKEQKEAVIKQLLESHAVLKPKEQATHPQKGDYVSVLIQGINETGELLQPDGEYQEQTYEIGGEILHEALEKALVEMKADESRDVEIDNKEKEIRVRVTLKAIKEKILPEVNDEFAKSCGPFENLAALQKRIEEDLVKEAESNLKAESVTELLAEILKKNPIELPESLVHNELHDMIHSVWNEMRRAGMKDIPEEYSEENLHKKLHGEAERRVHEQLLIDAIATKEKFEVDEAQVEERLKRMAQSAQVPLAEFRAYYEKTGQLAGLRFNTLAQKTLDFLLSKANIK